MRQLRAREVPAALSWLEKLGLVVVAVVAVLTLVAPLAPPAVFDELMYHLPYAREQFHQPEIGCNLVDWCAPTMVP